MWPFGAAWAVAQLHWLFWAYMLEIQGAAVFFWVWLAAAVFFAANIALLCQLLLHFSSDMSFHDVIVAHAKNQ